MSNAVADGVMHIVVSLDNMVKEPLGGGYSAQTVFLIVGAVLVSVIVWNFLLYYMVESVREVA